MSELPGLVDGRLAQRELLASGRLGRALALLNGDGEETRLVGGAVRDLLLGETPKDFDFATTATPAEVMRRAHAAGIGIALTGIAHGTITLIVDGLTVETTTLRRDVATDGRHATVAFGRDFTADAMRRDFTINAISATVDGGVHDPAGGLADLQARRVRFIGDPGERIREDFLRILRFFRFSARFARGALDADGLAATIRERAGLARLSRERVRMELLKLLVAPGAAEAVAALCDSGLAGLVLAGAPYPMKLARFIAIEAGRGAGPDPILRLAALGVTVREDAERLSERLRLSNAETARLESASALLESLHGLRQAPALPELMALLLQHGRATALDGLALAHADADPDQDGFSRAYLFLNEAPPLSLPFTGGDIVARGVAQGRKVGATLKTLQALWIRAGFPREPDRLAQLLDEALQQSEPSGG